jgi:hypothetical protein
MSDTTIRPWLAPARSRASVPLYLRTRLARARHTLAAAWDIVQIYSLIEAACLLAAGGFCAVFIAACFG